MEKISEMPKNIKYYIVAIIFLITLAFGGVQSCRLGRSMAECRQYREQLKLAENRESEIREVVGRTSLILSETANSVGELREKLKEVEDSYNYLWSLFYNDDDTVYNEGDEECLVTKD